MKLPPELIEAMMAKLDQMPVVPGTEALRRRLPAALANAQPGQALRDAAIESISMRKAREEFDWQPHAVRIAEAIRRDRGKVATMELAKEVALQLAEKGIAGRGGKTVSAETVKRELLRSGGFKSD